MKTKEIITAAREAEAVLMIVATTAAVATLTNVAERGAVAIITARRTSITVARGAAADVMGTGPTEERRDNAAEVGRGIPRDVQPLRQKEAVIRIQRGTPTSIERKVDLIIILAAPTLVLRPRE